MLIAVVLFILGLVMLIKGGDWFVDGSVGIAHRFHLPELLIGATVVSIGTTLPEVMVSSIAAVQGTGSMSYGNAVGSIICNTALIAALTIAIRPSAVDRKSLRTPVCFFFAVAAVYVAAAYFTREFTRPLGILLLGCFLAYMIVTVLEAFRNPERVEDEAAESKDAPLWKHALLLILGAVLIAVGAKLLVDNGQIIAEGLGVPSAVIALTFVALGTSLPELVTAITALVKGHSALSLGNIIGANIFNIVLVCGLSMTISPFALPADKFIAGLPSTLVVDLPVMLFVMGVMTLPALFRGKLSRLQGILLLCTYAAFCVFQFAF